MLYFSSDQHLNHVASIRMCERPFDTIEEMNRTLIQNINARVTNRDTLYLMGDVAHKGTVEEANKLIAKMNGKKILIRGNHDRQYDESLFEEICDFKEIHVEQGGQHYNLSLMHYPMMEWPKSHHGGIHLHGHSHNKPEYNLEQKAQGIRRYDVGVDANWFYPVSLQDILTFMELQ